ncbi:hypothetical protein [Alkaliphilus crotonatoxidans]
MLEKLNFLRKYNQDIRLVSINEVEKIEDGLIPNIWKEIFRYESINIRKDILLNVWEKYVGEELRNTLAYLSEYLEEIDMIEFNNIYSILYTIRNPKGDILYYEGGNPQNKFESHRLEKHWNKMPQSLKNFYENVHDGFFYYASESMGLVPISSVAFLGDDEIEWGILEQLEQPLQLNLNTSFGFFSNGMGSYIVIDSTNCNNDNAVFWSTKRQPKYNINFWDYVDEWIVIGFQS